MSNEYTKYTVTGNLVLNLPDQAERVFSIRTFVLAKDSAKAAQAALMNLATFHGGDVSWGTGPTVTTDPWPDAPVQFAHQLWPQRMYFSLGQPWEDWHIELEESGDGWTGELAFDGAISAQRHTLHRTLDAVISDARSTLAMYDHGLLALQQGIVRSLE